LAGGRLLPPEILAQTDPPPPEGSEFRHILPCSASKEIEKEIQLLLTRTRHGLSNEPSTKVLHRPYLPQNWDKLPKFVVFWTISTINDEKSAAKFHYIEDVSNRVVAQSIAF